MRSRFRRWFRNQSITRQVAVAVLATSGIALAIASVAFAAYDYRTARNRLVNEVTTLAGVIGSNSTAALIFGDEDAAGEMATAASQLPDVRSLRVFTRGGRVLAIYRRPGDATDPPAVD